MNLLNNKKYLNGVGTQAHGFSLLEIMIALGVMSVGAVGIMNLMSSQNSQQKKMEDTFEIDSIHSNVVQILGSTKSCSSTLLSLSNSNPGIYTCNKTTSVCSLMYQMGTSSTIPFYGIRNNIRLNSFIEKTSASVGDNKIYELSYYNKSTKNNVLRRVPMVVPSANTCFSADSAVVESTCNGIGGSYDSTKSPACDLSNAVGIISCKLMGEIYQESTKKCISYTEYKCVGAGRNFVTTGGVEVCRVTTSPYNCPSGWTKTTWTESSNNHGCGGSTTGCGNGDCCNSGSHIFSPVGDVVESCWAARDAACGPAHSGGHDVYATKVAVGCICSSDSCN